VAAYLGRYRGESRVHTGSDLKVFLTWCADQGRDPLNLGRVEIERYVRWLQEVRCYQPSTVSRRLSVVVGFYRVCVIDQILVHSPADYVRRPPMPTESPTLGLGRLRFEALLTTARLSTNRNDFALIAMLSLLGLRIFEACGANIADLGEEHGHRVLKVRGKGGKTVLIPLTPAVARAIEHVTRGREQGPILRNTAGRRMDRHAATRRSWTCPPRPGSRCPACIRADRRPTCRPQDHHALRPSPQEPRPAPELHPRRLHDLRNLTATRAQDNTTCRGLWSVARSALLGEALLTSRSVPCGSANARQQRPTRA
jgi:integrase/recombinase XerD